MILGRMAFATLALAAMMMAAAVPASAQTLAAVDSRGLGSGESALLTLQPGQYRWFDIESARVSAPVGPISILVSLPEQRAYVYRGAELIGVTTVSTGKPGHETPVGEFTILQKRVHHRSNIYSNAPMPFMQRLTWDGIALHAGRNPGRPASHGCIRLPRAFAERLFSLTDLGGIVTITDQAVTDPGAIWAPPIRVDTDDLGGEPFNVVTAETESWPGPAPTGGSWAQGAPRD
jgi:lipoprotein-anchoring transpeptidase ErfK/SrfK